MIPWSLLYQLSGRDQQVTWLEPVIELRFTSAALNNVEANFVVPVARALILTQWHVESVPGAAQNINASLVGLRNPNATLDIALRRDRTVLAANIRSNTDWQGFLVLPAGATLFALTSFNAAAAANRVDLDLMGVLIPVGNIQR